MENYNSNFRSSEPSLDLMTISSIWSSWQKKINNKTEQINTHLWSFFWQKLRNFISFQMETRNPYSMVLWCAESEMNWLFKGVPALSKNHTNFLRFVAFIGYIKLGEYYISGVGIKIQFQLMYLLLWKFRVLQFRLLFVRVASYLQHVYTNYLISSIDFEFTLRKDIGGGHGQ